jgi:hypothetical protein
MNEECINIEDYYTEKNEKEGVWHEPVFNTVPCGLKFLLIGVHSKEGLEQMAHYDELEEKLRASEKDQDVLDEKLKRLDAERVASITKDIKTADGKKIMKDGKVVEFSKDFATELYLNGPVFKIHNIEFAIDSANFIKKNA